MPQLEYVQARKYDAAWLCEESHKNKIVISKDKNDDRILRPQLSYKVVSTHPTKIKQIHSKRCNAEEKIREISYTKTSLRFVAKYTSNKHIEKEKYRVDSPDAVKSLLKALRNLKHQCILLLTYAVISLRIREATRLGVSDIQPVTPRKNFAAFFDFLDIEGESNKKI